MNEISLKSFDTERGTNGTGWTVVIAMKQKDSDGKSAFTSVQTVPATSLRSYSRLPSTGK